MNIGIFSGSFNPIHIGHVILGNYIAEFTDMDEVWFLVSPHNPLKENADLLDEKERFAMVELALKDYPTLKASDFEFLLSHPSYTINTLHALDKAYPEHQFSLIIGADNWVSFDKWKDYATILAKYPIKIYPRLGFQVSIPSRQRSKVEVIDTPIMEISSTFIRESIAEDKNVKAFLPEGIYEYIKQHRLYQI